MINKEHTYNIDCMYVLNFLLAIIMIGLCVLLLVVSHPMLFFCLQNFFWVITFTSLFLEFFQKILPKNKAFGLGSLDIECC
jgi:hypothetical protein